MILVVNLYGIQNNKVVKVVLVHKLTYWSVVARNLVTQPTT